MSLVDEIEATLNKYSLVGCSCCVDMSEYQKDYPDDCPVDEDGWVDHEYGQGCSAFADRKRILAELVAEMLEKRT